MKSATLGLAIIAVICFCNSQLLIAQWSTDPNVNNPICTEASDQMSAKIVSDDSGGAIITWQDWRNVNGTDIYAQRISASGVVRWTLDGVPICTETGGQTSPAIVSDGNGGAIITWSDYRSGGNDIYAQRINAGGAVQWTPGGVAICTTASEQYSPNIISDGSGGAIIAWYDYLGGGYWHISVQRIGAGGAVQWPTNGVVIATATYNQKPPNLVSDGSGGAIISWCGGMPNVYAQRISAGGAVQWTPNGVAICTASIYANQGTPNMVSDGNGGAIITWWNDNSSGNYKIYAQRINADSTLQWTASGVTIYSAPYQQTTPTIASDDSGGAIIIWEEYISGYYYIYAQRIIADGTVQWTENGVSITTALGNLYTPIVISDGSGGAIITGSNGDIYAQRISAGGEAQWTVDGVSVCTATGSQLFPVLINDGSGGAIITWFDGRTGYYDIYAQRVYSNGNLYTSVKDIGGIVPKEFTLCQNYPNPFNPSTTIEIGLPLRSRVTLRVYNILGQEVALLMNGRELSAGPQQISWMANLPSGVYVYRMEAVSISDPSKRFVEAKKMLLVK